MRSSEDFYKFALLVRSIGCTDVGPVIPVAEKAIETGSPDALIRLLTDTLRQEVQHRFEHIKHLRDYRTGDVAQAREYVEAMLGLEVYSHHLYQAMKAKPTRAVMSNIMAE